MNSLLLSLIYLCTLVKDMDEKGLIKYGQVIGRNGGEDTLAHWPNDPDVMTVDVASCEVLKYLEKVWGSLTSSGAYTT